MPGSGRTFRLFVSSTFSDLKAERNALQAHVFPRLRRLCLLHDSRFQDIDLRWGVSQEAGLDQRTMRICLQEVARCQETTPRPNFVVLLGDRYGWRPLPSDIPAALFPGIRAEASTGELALLDRWYRLDHNSVPPSFRLEPRGHGTPEADYAFWRDEVESPLHGLLARIDPGYGVSATHREIAEGVLASGRDQHVFGFFRSINGFPERGAGDFRDTLKNGAPDDGAKTRLENLKDQLSKRLGTNRESYSARWLTGGETALPPDSACEAVVEKLLGLTLDCGGTEEEWTEAAERKESLLAQAASRPAGPLPDALPSPISLDHLPALCADVFLRLAWIMLQEISAFRAMDPVDRDRSDHGEFGAQRSRDFVGRRATLDAIRGYLRAPAEQGKPPFAVVGESGSGKTALLAHAASEAALMEGTRVIVRFVGATPESTEGRSVLLSLSREIARFYGSPEAGLPDDYRSLKDQLPERLGLASREKPLAIFVDAVDMLSPVDRANALGWLPRQLPPWVSLVVSTTPGESSEAVERRVGGSRVRLDTLTIPEGVRLLRRWLDRGGRSLTRSQRRTVIAGFAPTRLPLYLKLAFETAREWPSFFEPAPLPADVPGLIGALFDRLSEDQNHGGWMVSRSLGLLAAARNGLTEDEILDLLSRDAGVMASFRERSPDSPPVSRLPVVVWSRLYHDLQSYLSRQHADGTVVLTYYHQQVKRAAVARYLGPADRPERHRELARYFKEDRRLGVEAGGRRVYNLRKLAEQPFQEAGGALWRELARTLTHLDFVQAKVEAGIGYDAIADYERALQSLPAPPRYEDDPNAESRALLREFGTAFNQEASAFLPEPATTAQQIYNNLFAQGGSPEAVGAVLATFPGPREGSLPWLRRINRSPGTSIPRSLVRTIAAHDAEVTALALSPGGEWIAAGARNGMIRVFRRADGAEAAAFRHDGGAVDGLGWIGAPPGPARLVSAGQRSEGSRITAWDWEAERPDGSGIDLPVRIRALAGNEAGECVLGGDDYAVYRWRPGSARPERLYRHEDRVLALALAPAGVVLSGGADRAVRYRTNGTPHPPLRGHERPVRAVALGRDGTIAVSGDETGQVRVWSLAARREPRVIAAHAHRVNGVGLLPSLGEVVSGSTDATIRTWDATTGHRLRTLSAHTRPVTCLVTDPERPWLASGGEDRTVRIWELEAERHRADDSGEHEGPVTALAQFADGRVISASEDQTVRLWSSSGDPGEVLRGHTGPVTCLLPGDQWLLSGSADQTIRRWHLDGSRRVDTWGDSVTAALAGTAQMSELGGGFRGVRPSHTRPVRALARLDSATVVSAAEDGTIRSWSLEAGPRESAYEPIVGGLFALVALDHWIVAGGTPAEILLWERAGGPVRERLPGHRSSVTCLAGLGGRAVASGSLDGEVRVWSPDQRQGELLWRHAARVNCIGSDPAHPVLASGAEDGTVCLGPPGGAPGLTLRGHAAPVRVLAFADTILATGDDDGRVNLWRTNDGVRLHSASLGSPVSALLPQGNARLWAGTRSGTVALFHLEPGGSI
jgi:WD40 repeat protein